MKTLFGRFLVFLALKIRVPIFVVYYFIITMWLYLLAGDSVADFVNTMFLWPMILLTMLFYLVLPVIWTYTSGGLFWKVPKQDTASKLFR